MNVITKSGTNSFHGDIYEYFRNTVLDARNYFDITRPQWNQNQYGGTFGGPLKKDRTFFFVSYEGRRIREGLTSQAVAVPTGTPSLTSPLGEFAGDFSGAGTFTGGIANSFVAQVLDGRPGCDTALGYTVASLGPQPLMGRAWRGLSQQHHTDRLSGSGGRQPFEPVRSGGERGRQ